MQRLITGVILGGIILGVGIFIGLWIENHKFEWNSPIHFQSPLKITRKQVIQNITIVQAAQSNTPLTPTQQYICDKFGSDCKMALAIAKTENGTWQCDRYNINPNGTLDWGLFQINTVHLKNIDLKSLLDCKANVEYAYKLFKDQGWTPWVAYQTKSYLKFMY